MTSVLKSMKQVPVNSGYFVAVVGSAATSIYAVATNGTVASTTPATGPAVGTLYKDLGVTVNLKSDINTDVKKGIYRKVVSVSTAGNQDPTEVYIKLDGATCPFARMG